MTHIIPTPDDCNTKRTWDLPDGRRCMALWYPQMGGYVGRCLAVWYPTDGPNSCFDVVVWHDGEFPFSDETPRELHHCDPEQFIHFGESIRKAMS